MDAPFVILLTGTRDASAFFLRNMLPATLNRLRPMLSFLADGSLHSGAALAEQLGVSRKTVWRWANILQSYNIDIVRVKGKGYRLSNRYDLLDEANIRLLLGESNACLCRGMECFLVLDSTNTYLLDRAKTDCIHRHVVLAEYQTQGRGRRGKRWISPFGCGLNISIGMNIKPPVAGLSWLSVVIGIAVVRALKQHVTAEFQLKWPNDIIIHSRKLGGVLLEARSGRGERCHLVIGIGLNIRLPKEMPDKTEQGWIDLASTTESTPSRNQLAASLIKQIGLIFSEDVVANTPYMLKEWQRYDFCYGRQLELSLHDKKIYGTACGIDDRGRLLLMTAGVLNPFELGEITVRVQ